MNFRTAAAASLLNAGEVLATATEAVWGLSCRPDRPEALLQLLALKRRDPDKGLILVAESADRFEALLSALPANKRQAVLDSWPGPVTWLVPHNGLLPRLVTGSHDSIALRVTAHGGLGALCAACDSPLVSTSANRSGQAPARTAIQVRKHFKRELREGWLGGIVPGKTGGASRPSQIIDALSGEVLRA